MPKTKATSSKAENAELLAAFNEFIQIIETALNPRSNKDGLHWRLWKLKKLAEEKIAQGLREIKITIVLPKKGRKQ